MSEPEAMAYYLLKDVARAARDFALLEPGDRIAVGVSGGKDSRVLLDLLLRMRRQAVGRGRAFEIVAVHINGTEAGLPDVRPVLEPWFHELGVTYVIDPLVLADDEPRPPDCFRCSFNRRRALFLAADRLGCNKVAFGHHADDAAATTLLNLLTSGRLETLDPCRSFFKGQLTVIRPMIYLAEAEIVRYARAQGWQLPPELTCERGEKGRRAQVDAFLHSLGRDQTQARANLWRVARAAMESRELGANEKEAGDE